MDVPSTHLDGRPSQDGIMSDEWCNVSIGDSILAKKEEEKKDKLAVAPTIVVEFPNPRDFYSL